jgi:hypothetical protein
VDCQEAQFLISALVDDELEPDQRPRLEAHLRECGACAGTLEAFRHQDGDLRRAFAPRRKRASDLAERVMARLPVGAFENSDLLRQPTFPEGPRRVAVPTFSWIGGYVGLAVAVFFVGMSLWALSRLATSARRIAVPPTIVPGNLAATRPTPTEQLGRLAARPRPPLPVVKVAAVGETLRTPAGERRRVGLPDGSVLYLNQNTTVSVEGQRELRLTSGEIFLEQKLAASAGADPVVIHTAGKAAPSHPEDSLLALGAKVAVQVTQAGTGLAVVQGQVVDGGLTRIVPAGYLLPPGGSDVVPAPRATHVLDWTRDLLVAAESPLVPGGQHAGGALVAVDPYGQEAKLSLRKFHIDVHIEDGFARTTIDQTYFNHAPWRLEGTFYFPLPPDASLSRLAMYVDDKLMEGGMAERDHARQVYERILYSQRDPALLEWVDGSTFKMRVFPLEGRQEKRIVLSYVQRLPSLYGRTSYRFPAGHSLDVVRDWSFHARIKQGAGAATSSPSHPGMKVAKDGPDLVLDDAANNVAVNRDVVLELQDRASDQSADVIRFHAAEHEGARYLMVRYRPQLAGNPGRQRRDWVFLFESSADRDPLLARVQVDVIRSLLNYAESDDTFAVLTAGTRVQAFAPALQPVTPESVQAAISFLESSHLIGALDLGRAFDEAARLVQSATNPCLIHLGGGLAALGERRDDALLQRLPKNAAYVGVGVGKRWNRALMKNAAERTGGYFTQINPDEPVAWRGFELAATLNTPRLLDVNVVDQAEQAVFLRFAQSLAQGEELCAVTRLDAGQPLPAAITVTGTLDGQPFHRDFPVENVHGNAGHLPRTWARLEIDRLLAEDAHKNKDRIVELSKAMYVMTPFTSLLVLENEDMYRQFQVDRGRKDHWAMYPCPDKIPVVYEPDPNQPIDPRAPQTEKPHRNQVMQTVVQRQAPSFMNWNQAAADRKGISLWDDLGFKAPVEVLVVKATSRTGVERGPSLGDADGPLTTAGKGKQSFRLRSLDRESEVFLGRGFMEDSLGYQVEGKRLALALSPSPIPEASASFADSPVVGQARKAIRESDSRARFWFGGGYNGGFGWGSFGGLGGRPAAGRHSNAPISLGLPVQFAAPRAAPNGSLHNPALDFGYTSDTYFFAGDSTLLRGHGRLNFNGVATDEYLKALTPEPTLEDLAERGTPEVAKQLAEIAHDSISLLTDQDRPPQLYDRPRFSADERVFTDLLAYAPGMGTMRADIQALLEAEAAPQLGDMPGHIDPAARKLIDQSRTGGWQVLPIPATTGTAIRLHFDGQGRFAFEHVLPLGLREQVICDGQTLLHLYPELGVGARRVVSRFHRADFASLVPWVLPPAEDLARGTDLRLTAANTVSILPHDIESARDAGGKPAAYRRIDLLFADGRLAERRLVAMPEGKTLLRETFDAPGSVKVLDGDGKELSVRKWPVEPGKEPNLRPDVSRLVVLSLPWRSVQHVYHSLGLNPHHGLNDEDNGCFAYLEGEFALSLFAAECAAGRWQQAHEVYLRCFRDRDDLRPGFYTLLAAAGCDLSGLADFRTLIQDQPDEPILRYLALYYNRGYQALHRRYGINAGPTVDRRDSFLQRLATFRDRFLRWDTRTRQHPWPSTASWPAEQERSLEFVRKEHSSVLGLALLCLMQDRADTGLHRRLVEVWRRYADHPELKYIARYEQARSLWIGGQREESRKLFQELFTELFQRGVLPAVDAVFVQALQGDGKLPDLWDPLMRQTAATLVEKKQRPAVILLAWQCHQLGDQPLAANLLGIALADLTDEDEVLPTKLAAVEYLWRTRQLPQADVLLQSLLTAPRYADQALLWRLGSKLAEERGFTDHAILNLEKALALEYQHLPEVINLQSLRADYGKLLAHYQSLVVSAMDLKAAPPDDLLARTVRAADRWRALDREVTQPCQAAAEVLNRLGSTALAWDYLTTPHASSAQESAPWWGMAQDLNRKGAFLLADRAFEAAAEADPENAQILWERSQNLRQANQPEEATALLRRIDARTWPAQYQGVQTQARRLLEGRRE